MIDQAESGAQPEIIQHVCEITATLMLDRNKKVQVSACSALGTYIEHFADHIIPFLQPLLSTFIKAMYMYRARSFIVLCSTMSLMANVIGEPIGEGNLPQIYMPALLESWMRYEHHNRRLLLPLLECLACIALALQNSFQPWALLVFEKAMSTIEACIMSDALLASEVEHDEPLNEDSDIIVCSADLLDG
jgi:transportin-1